MSNKTEKRATITFTDLSYHVRLAKLARKHKLSQGEIVEVLMDNIFDEDKMAEHFGERRRSKVGSRTSIRATIQREREKRNINKGEKQ